MGKKRGPAGSPADNEAFAMLIQVAREDGATRERLKAILALGPFDRKSALNTLLREMSLKGAPSRFVAAMACFLDDRVAEEALALLEQG